MFKTQTGSAGFSTGAPAATVALVAPKKPAAGGSTIVSNTACGEDADWRPSFSKHFSAWNPLKSPEHISRPAAVRDGRPIPAFVRALSSQYAGTIAKLLLALLAVADAV